MSIFGSTPIFDCKSDEWPVHLAQLNNFFVANDISDVSDASGFKRRAILLNCMTQDSYRLVKDLLNPGSPESTSYVAIVQKLTEHFEPKKCTFVERQKFYEAKKSVHESLNDFAARLRGLATHCKFGPSLEMCLTDRFVLGLDAAALKEKLFREEASALTMTRALELARVVDSAMRAVTSETTDRPVKEESLLFAGAVVPSGGAAGASAAGPRSRCCVCGARSHDAPYCNYKNLKCHSCGDKGHLKSVCPVKRNKKSKVSRKSHYIGRMSESDDGSDEFAEVNNIKCVEGSAYCVEVRVRDVALRCEVDSGSAVSALPARVWNRYFAGEALGEPRLSLRTYDGARLRPLGMCTLPVLYKGVTHNLQFYVVERGSVPLLGRDFLCKYKFELVPMISFCNNITNIKDLFSKYEHMFSDKLGKFNKYEVSLYLKENSTPKFFKARPVPYALRDKVECEIDKLVSAGILKPVSCSRYASPIVAVLKKNNDIRICGDYSVSINKQLKIDHYPLPKFNDLCVSLGGCKYFTKLDLSNSYNQFVLDERSQEYTCINTSKGLFQYTRLVFGLSSAPAIFQRAMVEILRGLEGVAVFIDDILIAAPTARQHWRRVEAVLTRLQDAGLVLQRAKCVFFQTHVEYLGYIIDEAGIHTDPDKVAAILGVKVPDNIKQLKSFLGLINFYRNFIPNASMILEPLHSLLRKDSKWTWSGLHQKAFEDVKSELSNRRFLAHYDPKLELVLTVDASPSGLGAVLAVRYESGVERPLCYASRSLSAAERGYSQIHKEATAIVFGVKKYHQYLYGRAEPFILRTDHRPLLTIFSNGKGISQMTEARLQRYALFLAAYNYKIEYVRSDRNVADYLSRFPVGAPADPDDGGECAGCVHLLDAALPASVREVSVATAAEPVLAVVCRYVREGWPTRPPADLIPYYRCRYDLHVDDGCLMRGQRLVLPQTFRRAVLAELHAAHQGVVKMKSSARRRFWYPDMDRDIADVAANCGRCAVMRAAPAKSAVETWEWPRNVFDRIHVDFFGPLKGRMYLVLVDAHSKWIECTQMKTLSSTAFITKLRHIFARFGLPKLIVSDNAKTFTSSEFIKFCADHGIERLTTSVYTPQSNGLAENAVKTCKSFLKKLYSDRSERDIDSGLAECLFQYRSTPHCTTGVSPARLMLGRELRTKLDTFTPRACDTPDVRREGDQVAERVRQRQVRQKQNFSGKSKRRFDVGNKVWARDYSDPQKPTWTLGTVSKRFGKVMYDILIDSLNVTWRRHVNQLLCAKSVSDRSDHSRQPIIFDDFFPSVDDVTNVSVGDSGAPVPGAPAPTSSPGPLLTPPARDEHAVRDHAQEDTLYRTRSGRTVRPPNRIID